jgi:hypothetical protein
MTTQWKKYTGFIAAIVSILALIRAIYDVLVEFNYFWFYAALAVFIISGIYYLVHLYRSGKRILFWILLAGFYLISVVFVGAGGWYYFTHYDPDGFPIENLNANIFPYNGVAANATEQSSVNLSLNTHYKNFHTSFLYWLTYVIPTQNPGWAGFTIQFEQPVDLRHYRAIQFQIQYADMDGLVELHLKDDAGNYAKVRLDSYYLKKLPTDLQTVQIPLELYKSVTLDHVKEIVFAADYTFIHGKHSVLISHIHFVK